LTLGEEQPEQASPMMKGSSYSIADKGASFIQQLMVTLLGTPLYV